MKRFTWVTVKDVPSASAALKPGAGAGGDAALGAGGDAALLAGGLDLLTQMKQGLAAPARVVDLKSAEEQGLRTIESDKYLRVGALVTLTALTQDDTVREWAKALADAASVVGSPQIRNVGTVGGNLCQRPRCWYFRDGGVQCLKKGGADCYAETGRNAYHAVLEGGPCWMVHPSDLAPALLALDGRVLVHDGAALRGVPAADFFVPPTVDVTRETILKPGEIVTGIEVSVAMRDWKSAYFKMRERESFDWALASAAVALKFAGDVVEDARVVLGGVAPIPLRAEAAEAALRGQPLTDRSAKAAGEAAFRDAAALEENGYKKKLGANVVRIAALQAGGRAAAAGAEAGAGGKDGE